MLHTLTPLILPFLFTLCINLLIASVTRRKTKGDRGHPCWMPLVGQKNFEGAPLISTAKEVDWMHPKTQSTISITILILVRRSLRKVQLTLSCALDKSNFRAKAHCFYFLIVWIAS